MLVDLCIMVVLVLMFSFHKPSLYNFEEDLAFLPPLMFLMSLLEYFRYAVKL
jgi:hypothetical protein